MPKSPEDAMKYEEMLDQLMDEYPQLEEEASALKSSLMEAAPEDEEDMPEMDMADEPELDMEEEEDEELPLL